MRIHTNKLRARDFFQATSTMPGVYVTISERGSQSHSRAFEIRLTGTSSRRTMDGADQAATWDEWGVFFARLFDVDPDMVAGSVKRPNYANGPDFHYRTGTRFADLTMPEDTHQQHRWEFDGATLSCTKCTAVLNRRY